MRVGQMYRWRKFVYLIVEVDDDKPWVSALIVQAGVNKTLQRHAREFLQESQLPRAVLPQRSCGEPGNTIGHWGCMADPYGGKRIA
jgi:hypothetical protein